MHLVIGSWKAKEKIKLFFSLKKKKSMMNV